jgi:hypothetical protein
MNHIGAVSHHRHGLWLAIAVGLTPTLVLSADQPPAETEIQSSYYTYHDDWAIVSAPPPPGPYQSVNIDPRIPGQEDVVPQFAGGLNASPAMNDQLPEDFMGAPPAAGIPSPPGAATYHGQDAIGYQPPPGYYSSREYGARHSAPVQPYRSPYYGYPQPVNPRYGYQSQPWNGAPVQRTEDEVPPPSVYNRMVVPPPPGYRGGPAPDQRYRRGTGTQ